MFRNSFDYSTPQDNASASGEASLRWLRGTRQLDVMNSVLRNRVSGLVPSQASPREKAIALHDFVRTLPFGCVPDYSALTASDVLKLGSGDCFAKGMLMVAMLRVAQIPARLRFVSLPVDFLRGIADLDESSTMHAMAEAYLENRWVVTDSYVPDAALFAGASRKLLAEKRNTGYGIHLQGAQRWDGLSDASAQCFAGDSASLPLVDWGTADDPESFYADASHSELRRNFATRLKWRLGASVVNKRVAALRVKPKAG